MATPPFKDDTFLARWLSGELSVEEEKEFRAQPDFAAYERMVGKLSRMAPPAFDAAAGFEKLTSERANRKGPTNAAKPALHPRPRLIKRLLPWSAAAGVLLLLTAWFLLRTETDRYETTNGSQEIYAELPDGSSARLNAGSDLAFSATTKERTATLNGEAYFVVKKSTVPFVVKTELGEVRVLGTSFNVYARAGEMAVSCTTGKVSVRFEDDTKNYPITPGQSVGRNKAGVTALTETTSPDQLDWLSGKSVFIKRPLAEIMDELERQFDLTINCPAALDQNQTLTVTFQNDNLNSALGNVLDPIKGYEYELKGRTVTFIAIE